MGKVMKAVVAACATLPSVLGASVARAQSIDCSSAAVPNVSFKTYVDTCRAEAVKSRAGKGRTNARASIAAANANVFDSRTTVAALDFADVPIWADADIVEQFASSRDVAYLTTPDNPTFQRRISWMYPDDGCFSRAEQLDLKVAEAGLPRPHKLFAFGSSPPLRAYTSNTPGGVAYWWYHVVGVVKNNAGEPIVFDAALNPCRPLSWKTWLGLMTDDLTTFDDIASGNGVSLGDSWAYNPFSLASGEPSHAPDSLNDQTNWFLPAEWSRQVTLGREPSVVLGATPPWSGFGCLSTQVEFASTTVTPDATATVTATCPFATKIVGGGFQGGASDLTILVNARRGNSWQITGKNSASSGRALAASAVCLTGAPSDASVSTVVGPSTSVEVDASASSYATCGSGRLIGGGYTTSLGLESNSMLRVYSDGRTTSGGNTWRVSAFNATSSPKSVTAYAYCLANTDFEFGQVAAPGLSPEGSSSAACPESTIVLGGGFVFPRTTDYAVAGMQAVDSTYQADLTPSVASGDANARAFAQCLFHR